MTEPTAPPTDAVGGATTCYRHPGRETGVRCSRCERPICPDCMLAASVGFQCPECVREGQRGVRSARTIYGGRSTARAGQVSIVLIALNVGVLLAKLSTGATPLAFSGSGGTSSSLDARFALLPARYDFDHEYYRFLTSMFLHTGLIHLALNAYAIYLLGPALEAMLGRWRFLALYLFAGLGGSALSYVTNQGGEGASGAVFGLFAAFYVFGRHQRRDTSQILGVIVANLIFSMVVPNIGYWAHIGGLVAGGIIALGIAYAPRGSLHLPVQLSGFALVGLLVVALAAVGSQQTLTFGGKSPEPNGVLSTPYHGGTAPEHGGHHA